MFGLDLLPIEAIGAASSFVAALLSLIPALGKTSARRATVAIGTLILTVLMKDGFAFASWQVFGETLTSAAIYAVVSYKMVLQPLVLPQAAKAFGVEVHG